MNISVVIPCVNQEELTRKIIKQLSRVSDQYVTEIVVLDNGSTVPFKYDDNLDRVRVIRFEEPIGVYPTIFEGLKHTSGDIIANFHNDLIIWEDRWSERVIDAFIKNSKLGLLGFVGSNQIDPAGGRGAGTTSNFQGLSLDKDEGLPKSWKGSNALLHGSRSDGYSKAAIIDGCAMIFRREALSQIKQRDDFPPHHFYDKLLSCETMEHGWEVGVLGIKCDHFSNQTVGPENGYQEMAKKWLTKHGHPTAGIENFDDPIYRLAENAWLTEYAAKGYIPLFV